MLITKKNPLSGYRVPIIHTLSLYLIMTEIKGICLLHLLTVQLFMVACEPRNRDRAYVRYKDRKQLLTVNEIEGNGDTLQKFTTLIMAPDTVAVGEEFAAKVFLSTEYLNIADAYVNCAAIKWAAVDTMTYEIEGCEEGLVVKDDTVFIGFRAKAPGTYKFPEITILTVDPKKIFRAHKYAFSYTVKKNIE